MRGANVMRGSNQISKQTVNKRERSYCDDFITPLSQGL